MPLWGGITLSVLLEHMHSLVSLITPSCSEMALNKNKTVINGDCQMIASKLHSCSELKHQGNR